MQTVLLGAMIFGVVEMPACTHSNSVLISITLTVFGNPRFLWHIVSSYLNFFSPFWFLSFLSILVFTVSVQLSLAILLFVSLAIFFYFWHFLL